MQALHIPCEALAMKIIIRIKNILLVLLVSIATQLCASSASALPNHTTPARTQFPDFELPLIDGSRFIDSQQFQGTVTVINYWRSDCPGCIAESQLLNNMALQHTQTTFIGVAIDERTRAMRFLTKQPSAYLQTYAPLSQSQLLHRAGNSHNGLPYTVVLDPQQQICARRLGTLDQTWLELAIKECQHTTK